MHIKECKKYNYSYLNIGSRHNYYCVNDYNIFLKIDGSIIPSKITYVLAKKLGIFFSSVMRICIFYCKEKESGDIILAEKQKDA